MTDNLTTKAKDDREYSFGLKEHLEIVKLAGGDLEVREAQKA